MRYAKWLGTAVVAGCAIVTASCGGRFVKEERLPTTGATLEGTVTYGSEKVPAALVIVAGGGSSATGDVDEAKKVFAAFKLSVGDVVVAKEHFLKAEEPKPYTFTATLKKGKQPLAIQFLNDEFKEGEYDRNLYVHAVKLEPKK